MLSKEDKIRIHLEETYRTEVKKQIEKKSLYDRIEGPTKVFQAIAIIVGVILSVLQFRTNSNNQREEAARDYKKAFYQEQMKVYAEAVSSTAIISTAEPGSQNFTNAHDQFYQLFWGRMSMFEDKCVEQKMVQFRKLLIKFDKHEFTPVSFRDSCNNKTYLYDTVDQVTLKFASLQLAHQCRVYTITHWLPAEEQKTYNLDIRE